MVGDNLEHRVAAQVGDVPQNLRPAAQRGTPQVCCQRQTPHVRCQRQTPHVRCQRQTPLGTQHPVLSSHLLMRHPGVTLRLTATTRLEAQRARRGKEPGPVLTARVRARH